MEVHRAIGMKVNVLRSNGDFTDEFSFALVVTSCDEIEVVIKTSRIVSKNIFETNMINFGDRSRPTAELRIISNSRRKHLCLQRVVSCGRFVCDDEIPNFISQSHELS